MAQTNSKQTANQNFGVGGSHSRSLLQPTFFGNNCLPPLSPLPHSELSLASNSNLKGASMEEVDVSSRGSLPSFVSSFTRENVFRGGESLPPRKGHRRSNSDTVPLAFSAMIQLSPQLLPISSQGGLGGMTYARDGLVKDKPILLQRREEELKSDGKINAEGMGERKSDGEVVDELFNSYMNLDSMDTCNPTAFEDKDNHSVASGIKTSGGESSNTEMESVSKRNNASIHGTSLREGIKRTATEDIAPARHVRSLSIDSAMGSLNFADESPKLPASLGNIGDQFSPRNSVSEMPAGFSLEFGNCEFSESELKRIMADERLAEIAISDPKRVKRVLANRQSAARSKERKLRYISELEYKVQTLQTEATTLSAQLTALQKDFTEITSQNNELKFRLQAMEQQAQLRDALHEALTAEVQRLKLAAHELREEPSPSNGIPQHIPMKHHMFQMQHQQPKHHHQLSVATSTTATGSTSPASA